MIKITRNKRSPVVPVSSMSDIGFLLLIFIMLLALINQRHEVKIDYPEAETVEKTQMEHNLEIWVETDGTFTVDGKLQTTAGLEQIIAAAVVDHPDVRIHIIADRNTPYRYVNQVVEVLQLLQHRVVSFVVREGT
ncbi:MAG: biopolymer transporter ExbD [Spirochaetaceae bacterium]|nr:biopolymer transporter ExbD [Spirochaetaceae bacterium]